MKSSAIDHGTGSAVPKESGSRLNLWNELILPTLLFAALGGMTWAVRGSSGFGASAGCIFAGVMWGAAWWYLARNPMGRPSRCPLRTSGWIVLAMTVGIWLRGEPGLDAVVQFLGGPPPDQHRQGNSCRSPGSTTASSGCSSPASVGGARSLHARLVRLPPRNAGLALGLADRLRDRRRPPGELSVSDFPPVFPSHVQLVRGSLQRLRGQSQSGRLYNDCNAAVTPPWAITSAIARGADPQGMEERRVILTVRAPSTARAWARSVRTGAEGTESLAGRQVQFLAVLGILRGLSIGIAYGIAYFLVNRPMSDREKAE